MHHPPSLRRRDVLRSLAALGIGAVHFPAWKHLSATSLPHDAVPARESRVEVENRKPGTDDWRLARTRVDPATRWRCPWIEGYASQYSVLPGETIRFHVNTRPASSFTLDLYRMGWYSGKGARFVHRFGPIQGHDHPDPEEGPGRLRDCLWPAALEWRVPGDAVSGVYLGKLTELREGLQSYVIFIVREDRSSDFLFQCSDFTWQAYNRWPSQYSLYDNGEHAWWWGGGVQVSANRPYGRYCQILDAPLSQGSGEFLLWEFPLAFWMESLGLDVTYQSNLDTHRHGAGLLRAKGFLSVGHDEYWTLDMFRNVQAAIQQGVNVAFFSGNAVCGRIKLHPDSQGQPDRVMERVGVFGPPGGTREFVAMSSLPHERPYANELVGAHSTGPVTGGADWICTLPDHWIFEGTGMKVGDSIPGLVGWEWHGDPAPIPGLEIVASGPTQDAPGKPNGGLYTATVYPGPKDNFVFNASTIWWADGIAAPPGYLRPSVYTTPLGPDERVIRITRNILDRMRRQVPGSTPPGQG